MLDVSARRAETRVALLALAAAALAVWLVSRAEWESEWVAGWMVPLAAVAVSAVAGLGFVHAGWFGARRLVRLSWLPDGRWQLLDSRGRVTEARLSRATRVWPGLVWLHWRVGRRAMLLAQGDLPRRDLRRLIVRLRLEGISQPPAALATSGVLSR